MHIPVAKDEEREGPVPTDWRSALKVIADALTFGIPPSGDGVREMTPEALRISLENIADYPDHLGPLSESTWDTSVYIWMRTYWDALIDLSAADGGRTDLVLQFRIYEAGDQVEFAPQLIYVP